MGNEQYDLIQEVVKLRSGDGKAFEKIYNLTNRSAYFTALKIVGNETDAQDVVQESYMIMIDKIGDLENPAAFSNWFSVIVANKAREFLRKNKKYVFTDDIDEMSDEEVKAFNDSLESEKEEFRPGTLIEQLELKSQVMALIDGLSDDKRTAILLYYYNRLSVKEISEALGVNENTVKSRLFYAKKDLAKGIEEIEKKNGKLLGAAPASVAAWALKTASATASTAFVSGGAAAETLAAVTAGAAAAGSLTLTAAASGASTASTVVTTSAAAGVLQKVAVGIAAVTVIGSAATVLMRVQRQRMTAEQTQSVSQIEEALTEESTAPVFFVEESGTFEADTEEQTTQMSRENSTTSETASARQSTSDNTQTASAGTSSERRTTRQRTTRAKATTTTRAAKETTAAATSATTKAAQQSETVSQKPSERQQPETAESKTFATSVSTTSPPTQAPTEAEKNPATVEIRITKDGVNIIDTLKISVKAGTAFTKEDVLKAVGDKGYNTDMVPIEGHTLPLTAEADKTYTIVANVE